MTDRLIVNHLSTHLTGGAAVAARRLHGSLRSTGVDSRFWYSSRSSSASGDTTVQPVHWSRDADWTNCAKSSLTWVWRRIRWKWEGLRHLRWRPKGFEIFTPANLPGDTRFQLPGDILHLHWVAKMIDVPSFFASLPEQLPVVWTLHDMNPFTGGCHFSSGCESFQFACGNCPQIARPHPTDLSHQIIRVKQDAVRQKNLHVVAPSNWLIEQARKSSVFSTARSFQTIPYGLDTSSMAPVSRMEARQTFQLPTNRFVLGFGADSVSNRRKGFAELLTALKQLRAAEPIIAVVFGAGELPAHDLPSVKIVPVGFVEGAAQLARLYSAMNVLVLPSIEDNLPQTGLESMACGTPVIAFDAGGIPDFVLPNRTGLLAKAGDAAELARKIQSAVDQPEMLEPWGRFGRQLMLERFTNRSEAKAYTELYCRVLEQQNNKHTAEAA